MAIQFPLREFSFSMANCRVFFVVLSLLSSFIIVSSQNLCTSSKTVIPSANNTIFIESFSANSKCLKMEGLGILPDSKVVLDECLYRTKASKDQQFQMVINPLKKVTFRQDAGRGESFCLTVSSSSSANELKNTICNMKSLDQSWTIKPVQGHPGQYLIEQFSSKKCLKPKSRATRSIIQLTTCNAHETEQIWKVYYSNSTAANTASPVIPC